MFVMADLQMHMCSVHPHQDSEMGFHLDCCLGFVHENVPSNQLSSCDLAEIYYLFFPIQVNAHTSPSIYSFIADFGPVSFGFLLFHSFLRRPLYWQLEPFGVFFLSGQKKSWITHSEADADIAFCSDICKHVSVTRNTSGLCSFTDSRERNREKCLKPLCMKPSMCLGIFQYLFLRGGVPRCDSLLEMV